MKIRLASPLQPDSIVDGPGIRTVVWTQGCSHNCEGCHNPTTHDFKGGFAVDTTEINKELDKLLGQEGITLSGGDPMFQAKACALIAKHAQEIGLNVWCYTGFKFEDLLKNKDMKNLLKYVDVLVDGKFVISQFTMNIDFRGSRNQRIIDVQASLKENKIILIDKYMHERNHLIEIPKDKHIYI
jgi:anaerobic ribonucleoside-triphosphate reductase activating protein